MAERARQRDSERENIERARVYVSAPVYDPSIRVHTCRHCEVYKHAHGAHVCALRVHARAAHARTHANTTRSPLRHTLSLFAPSAQRHRPKYTHVSTLSGHSVIRQRSIGNNAYSLTSRGSVHSLPPFRFTTHTHTHTTHHIAIWKWRTS